MKMNRHMKTIDRIVTQINTTAKTFGSVYKPYVSESTSQAEFIAYLGELPLVRIVGVSLDSNHPYQNLSMTERKSNLAVNVDLDNLLKRYTGTTYESPVLRDIQSYFRDLVGSRYVIVEHYLENNTRSTMLRFTAINDDTMITVEFYDNVLPTATIHAMHDVLDQVVYGTNHRVTQRIRDYSLVELVNATTGKVCAAIELGRVNNLKEALAKNGVAWVRPLEIDAEPLSITDWQIRVIQSSNVPAYRNFAQVLVSNVFSIFREMGFQAYSVRTEHEKGPLVTAQFKNATGFTLDLVIHHDEI